MAQAETAPGGAVEVLGRFIEAVRYEALPASVQIRSKIRLLDAVACVFAGRSSTPVRRALSFAQARSTAGPSSFWLAGSRGTVEDCVFANSIIVQSVMLDDSPHTGSVVIPTVLALGEAESRSGQDILGAIAIGYETLVRLESGGLTDRLDEIGFRRAAAPAAFAAAAAAASLAGLSAAAIADALALTVATCAPGSYAPVGAKHGTSERYVQLAVNARAGVLAAGLAKAGFTGIGNAFEGAAGLYAVYRSEIPSALLAGLGTTWHMENVSVKPYPCGSTNTGAIYCAEKMMRDRALRHEEIAGIEVRMAPWSHLSGVLDRGPFLNLEQALFSAPFVVAATFVHGVYNAEVLSRSIGDARVDALAQRVAVVETRVPSAVANPAVAEISVTLAGGEHWTVAASDMSAAIGRPSWDQMVARFEALATALPQNEREQIVNEVWGFDRRADCRALTQILRTTGGA